MDEPKVAVLRHYASPYYDPQKAHEYHMRTRELKGRSTTSLNDEGKKIWSYTKNNIKSEKAAKVKEEQEKRDQKITELREKAEATKEQISSRLKELNEALTQNASDRKKSIDTDKDSDLEEIEKESSSQKERIDNKKDAEIERLMAIEIPSGFIWTDRYYAYGDFELYEAMREGLLDYIKQDYYLQSKESEHVMIVEKIQITSDTEDGNHVTVTGRSLESILDRRIVWGQKLLSGNLQNGIKTLLNENVISPSDSNRKIPNFIFKESTDPAITKLKLEAQYTGDNLYDVIQKICEEQGIGFKITLNDEKQFVFELYAGSDRSYDQTENPYVIFSPKFENIINSNYIESKASLKTVTLVGGEGEGADRRYTTVGGGSGLNRRELFTDARDISSNVGSDDALTDAEYMAQLQQRGKEKLAENVSITSFEGETETTIMFQYGKDFFNGDIVQIANEYGHETKARILEIVRSEDKDGYSVYPTFKTIEQEGA